jgi:hypothetical protein
MMDRAELEVFERSLRHATSTAPAGADLDAALAELGWHDALVADPRAAVSVLFELQGAANATSSALGHVLATGSGATVLPSLGRWVPPGDIDGTLVRVRGLGTAALADHETVVVVATGGDEDGAAVVRRADLALRPVRGIDPWLGLVEVTGVAEPLEITPFDWPAAVARAQLAVGHELVGAAREMLELARRHSLERIQFGRPISAFQAVRHRLAETLVAIETADAVLHAAWDDGSPVTAAMAKALAGRGARTTARHCQQVLAGIGFTTEHPLHRYVRRVVVLDELLGSARALTRQLGEHLVAHRQLPPLLPL